MVTLGVGAMLGSTGPMLMDGSVARLGKW